MYVYKIQNKINGKSYIGITNNYKRRFNQHKRIRTREDKEYNLPLYKAFRKYGLENFTFEIIYDNLTLDEANNKEIFLIKELKTLSHQNGYNIREGGNLQGKYGRGEHHYNSKLTSEDVEFIIYSRDVLNERPCKIYKLFKDIISKNTFESIWLGNSWKHLQPTNIDSKKYHISVGEENPNALLKEKDVINIIKLRQTFHAKKDVFNNYKHKISKAGFNDIWHGKSWKYLQPSFIKSKGNRSLNDDDVIRLKELLSENKYSYKELSKIFNVPPSTISNIKHGKTYKHIN